LLDSHHQYRTLSCAALLAFGPSNDTASDPPIPGGDRLWLVDATGAYPVRAYCLGGGLTKRELDNNTSKGSGDSMVPTSDAVNQRLLDLLKAESVAGKHRLPYFDGTAEEGLEILIELLSGKNRNDPGKDAKESRETLLQKGTRLELGIVGSAQAKIVRKRVSELWGRGRANSSGQPAVDS